MTGTDLLCAGAIRLECRPLIRARHKALIALQATEVHDVLGVALATIANLEHVHVVEITRHGARSNSGHLVHCRGQSAEYSQQIVVNVGITYIYS